MKTEPENLNIIIDNISKTTRKKSKKILLK